MSAIVRTRRARRPHECSCCGGEILRGDLYEASSLPPGSDIGNTGWWRNTSHVGAYLPPARHQTKADHDRLGIGCDEAAAYLEAQHRMLAASYLIPDEWEVTSR